MSKVHHQPNEESTIEDLQIQLASLQRSRTLAMWHDHSTVLQKGYILFAVWIIYDPAVFYSEQECKSKCGISITTLQELIEQPMIHMIAPSTSSGEDQLSLVGDRIECLNEMSQPLTASNGVNITHTIFFSVVTSLHNNLKEGRR